MCNVHTVSDLPDRLREMEQTGLIDGTERLLDEADAAAAASDERRTEEEVFKGVRSRIHS